MAEEDKRDQEIADLKARLNAVETRPPPPQRPKRKSGCLPLLGALGVLVIMMGIIKTTLPEPPPPKPDPTGPDLTALGAKCDNAWAGRVRGAARGIVRGQDTDGLDLIVVVNPFRWSVMSLNAQRALGLALACQIDNYSALTVKFRYDREGRDVLRLGRVELHELGEARFVAAPTKPAPAGFRDLAWGAKPREGLHRVPDSDSVWTGPQKPPAPFMGVSASDEDYTFDRGGLFGGDVYFVGAPAYAAIKLALVKAYGPPSTANVGDDGQIYIWRWVKPKVKVQLSYTVAKASAILHFEKMR